MDKIDFSSIKGVEETKGSESQETTMKDDSDDRTFIEKIKDFFSIRKEIDKQNEEIVKVYEKLKSVESDNQSLKAEVFELKKYSKNIYEEIQIKKDETE